MSVLSKCKVVEKHVSRSKREVLIEIPSDVMRQAIWDYHQKADKDKYDDDKNMELYKMAPHIPKEEFQWKLKPMSVTAKECLEEFLQKNYPQQEISEPFMRIKTAEDDSITALIRFRLAKPPKPIKIKPFSVTKEKFCQAHVDKNIDHEIQKHREAIAVCTPIENDRSLRVNDSIIIDCEIAHHLENVLEIISGLSFDLIEEDHQKNGQKPFKKLKATHETLDKVSLSTLHFSGLLDEIENNEDFFHVKVGDTKKKEFIFSDEPSITIIIHVKKMYKKTLPPVNRQFAKSMGFASVAQMNKKLKEKYTNSEKERIETLLYNDTLREYLKKNPPGFFSKYVLEPAVNLFFKGTVTSMEESGIASDKLIDQKMKQWTKDGYVKKEATKIFREMSTIVKLARKWNLMETVAEEFKRTVITTPGLYEKLEAELPPKEKGKPQVHPMVFDIMRKMVIKGLLSEATVTEVEPTDRDERSHVHLSEARKATQSTTLTDAENLRSAHNIKNT